MVPVLGVPVAYHMTRQGRGNLPSTLAGLMISVGMTETAYWFGMRGQGYSSVEIFLARTGSAAGFRFGGRGINGLMLFGPRTTAGLTWAVPLWVYPLAAYEIWQAGDWWMEEGRFRLYDSLAYEYSQ